MKILINYSDSNFIKQQKKNSKSGMSIGGFDKVVEYGPDKMSEEFKRKHGSFIESNPRGGGYWIWKPYIIWDALCNHAQDGDYVFYCDSGSLFLNTIDHVINEMERADKDLFVTEVPLLEYQWTKEECFQALDCYEEKYLYTNQIQATYILIKKNKKTLKFIWDYIELCNRYSLLNDVKNEKNNKFLISHRHDQSLLSLLCKLRGIEGFRDISQYGIRPFQYITKERDFCIKNYKNSNYPQITLSYRKEKWWKVSLKEKIKDTLGFGIRI
ncbi:hypothetical protein [Domibacillus enclensis]|uniref:Uncharacterized protein n=1 Tax=Domibacillus enclensis TaxID=1017273 RepID=A0A1N6RP78_9BACI|nr:hypothetical protein [Domibacillus enclensis]OXS79111.1 hypothetical protein B1B05_04855 [Domibacillus enclensis]SIQ30599.1 hypothetical protein SAMN05443094_102182 [Domibacillus enclensis]